MGTKEKPTIFDVNLTVSQVSRVAVIGANGAGRSTAIKILVGEMTPGVGTIWKASGLRMAYVAQHAFHHLEKHMQETPTQYIMWRFAGNDDKESLEFKSDKLSVDEEKARAQKWCIDSASGQVRRVVSEKEDAKKHKQDLGNVVVPDAIVNRRNLKKQKTYEYDVKWQFKPLESNTWVERDTLIMMGFLKLVQREDEKQAAAAGLQTNQLSGGMKVKVVLAAAMWQNPHILILDEPTNYLDREGLGALVLAIKDYKGGVLIISHNKEFCDGVATEKWIMNKGYLRIEGESVEEKDEDGAAANKEQEDLYDGAGNKIDRNAQDTSTDKDKKKQLKALEKKINDNKKNKTLTDEELWELEDQVNALKEHLEGKKAEKK